MFTSCPNLMFLASPWLEIYRFSKWSFCFYFANFGQVKIDPVCSLVLTLDRSQFFYCVWVSYVAKNNPNPFRLIKIQEPCIESGTIIFNDSISGNQELVSSVNRQALKVQSFISFCNTFLWQNKLCIIRIKT